MDAAVSMRQKSFAVIPNTFPLCSTNSQPAAQAVGLAVLIRNARSVTQYPVAKKLDVYFPLTGRSRETRPVLLVHHGDVPTSTANRLVSGDLLDFESLKRSRNVVLSDVVRVEFLGNVVGHIQRRFRRQILQHVALVVRVGTGLAPLHRNAHRASAPGMSEGRYR